MEPDFQQPGILCVCVLKDKRAVSRLFNWMVKLLQRKSAAGCGAACLSYIGCLAGGGQGGYVVTQVHSKHGCREVVKPRQNRGFSVDKL